MTVVKGQRQVTTAATSIAVKSQSLTTVLTQVSGADFQGTVATDSSMDCRWSTIFKGKRYRLTHTRGGWETGSGSDVNPRGINRQPGAISVVPKESTNAASSTGKQQFERQEHGHRPSVGSREADCAAQSNTGATRLSARCRVDNSTGATRLRVGWGPDRNAEASVDCGAASNAEASIGYRASSDIVTRPSVSSNTEASIGCRVSSNTASRLGVDCKGNSCNTGANIGCRGG